jgi:uncharacterized membrane protein
MRDGDFRIRGKEISRVEGLSDAVFGFAITLLIVSLEVPKSAEEVLHMMRGFFAFAITFALLFMVWRTQFKFFRRYGLEDNKTVLLNAVLLFTILFFVYPLKFVFTAMLDRLVFKHFGYAVTTDSFSKGPGLLLMSIYFMGWAAVFAVFALMYRHALSKRHELQLNEIEEFDTRDSITATASASAMGIVATLMVLLTYLLPKFEDPISYGMTAVIFALLVLIVRRKRTRKARRREMLVARAAAQ